MIVDEMHEEHPELLKDQYWDEVVPKDLPYTVGSEHYRKEEPKGSAEFYKVKQSDALYANISNNRRKSVVPEDMYADYVSTYLAIARESTLWSTQLTNQKFSSILIVHVASRRLACSFILLQKSWNLLLYFSIRLSLSVYGLRLRSPYYAA